MKSEKEIIFTSVLFLVLGYAIFYAAVAAIYVLEMPKFPEIFSLKTAARVAYANGQNPFPIQLLMVYCVLGSIVLFFIFLLNEIYNKKNIDLRFKRMEKNKERIIYSNVRLLISAILLPIIFLFCWYVLFIFEPLLIEWRSISLYSNSFLSVSFLLVSTVVIVMGLTYFPMTLFQIYKYKISRGIK